MGPLLVIFCLALQINGERQYLRDDRNVDWETDNPNIGPYFGQPEQVHLSLGNLPDQVSITWLTFDDTKFSYVHYGNGLGDQLNQKVRSYISRFIDGGKKRSVRYIHRATIKGVEPGKRYCKLIE